MKISDILTKRPLGADILPYCIEINPMGTDQRGIVINNFNRIRETLKRVGIASTNHSNVLNQTCHVFIQDGKYYIMHFLMMFMYDGNDSKLTIEDIKRTERIANLLEQWGLCTIVNRQVMESQSDDRDLYGMRIIKYRDSNDWTYRSIYKMRKDSPDV